MLQAGARWKSRHKELVNLREGLYADIAAERDANQKVAAAEEKQQGGATVGKAIKGALGGVANRGLNAAMARIGGPSKRDARDGLAQFARRDSVGRTSFLT